MLTRLLVVLVLLPVGLAVIYLGGWAFALAAVLVLCLAVREYVQLFRAGNYKPSLVLAVAGVLLFVLGRAWNSFESLPWISSLVILAGMTIHLFAFEKGRDQAGSDWGVSLAGVFYIGFLGAYMISLRNLPDGMWWTLTVLPAVWFADSGAYLIGRKFGKHKMTPRLSPKKSWEGYIAGIIFGTLGAPLLCLVWGIWTGPESAVTPLAGAILGFILASTTILGDLGESMIKRQVGIKDSSHLLPGHGGAFDRIDSWLWAGVIGYYLIVFMNGF
jgi:phosphatidate cytidylyltransferase